MYTGALNDIITQRRQKWTQYLLQIERAHSIKLYKEQDRREGRKDNGL